ncbi:MAG: hypothetical protein JXM79_22630 [Sedimentisphaerales bacterium]|nr:hypothetical protein [Sedimentisphaerales bacterium]
MTKTTLMIALSIVLLLYGNSAADATDQAFEQAGKSADIAGYSLSKVHRWLHEQALEQIDPLTTLYKADGKWNYRDTAADCYPFLVWAAYVVDQEALDGPVRDILHAEMKLCNHYDRIPVPYDFTTNRKMENLKWDEVVFQASEYVKDGLIAIVEVTGQDEWFERMKGIEEDLWKYARIDTPYGKIPSTNVEVNGEQLQALIRLYTMTGEKKFLTWAERLGDFYLTKGHFVPSRLRDHGCEIIGGLGLLLGIESEVNSQKAEHYRKAIQYMFDQILARGLNPDGLMFNSIADKPVIREEGQLSDGWGYNYVGYLCYDMAVGKPVYRDQVERTLSNLLKPQYKDYKWEGTSIDGYADSIEGGIYLVNRLPVKPAIEWIDREVATNVARSSDPLETAELWGTMKLQANGVRTVIMHALMHTRGLIARPWRHDLRLGAAQSGDTLAIILKAEKPWEGKLIFDIPRYRQYMGFPKDWPRMNTLPEWFTVESKTNYTINNLSTGSSMKRMGEQLHAGLTVTIPAGGEIRLLVEPREK